MKRIDLRKLIGSIFGIMLFSLCIVYLTYAYYSWKGNNTIVALTINDATNSAKCLLGDEVNVSNLGPIFDYKTDGTEFLFSVKNDGSSNTVIDISLDITSITSSLLDKSFKYVLLKSDKVITKGDFSNFKVGNNSITTLNIEPGVFNYKFIVYIDGNLYNSPDMQNGELVSNLKLGNCDNSGGKLMNAIKKDVVGLDTSLVFSTSPSGTDAKGVYIRSGTENNEYPIYYYRGAVDNNNVLFAGLCFKMIRTTETGGIKLIYSGIAVDNQCNDISSVPIGNTTLSNIGYTHMHASTVYRQSNSIKQMVDDWYAEKILQPLYYDYLEDTPWCNDLSNIPASYNSSNKEYGANQRLLFDMFSKETPQPILECPNGKEDQYTVSSDIGNGMLEYPAGLLTADEVVLSLGLNSYISTGYDWWTLSPAFYSISSGWGGVSSYYTSCYVKANGELSTAKINDTNNFGATPAISLKPGITFNSGNGTKEEPYFIDTDIVESVFINEDFSDIAYDKNITVTNGATYPWIVDTEKGIFRSNNKSINNSQSISTISFNTNKAGVLTFDYGISAEGSDYLTITLIGSDSTNKVLVDDKKNNRSSYTENGTKVSKVEAGVTYTLELKYVKDSVLDRGDDIVWIDNLKVIVNEK